MAYSDCEHAESRYYEGHWRCQHCGHDVCPPSQHQPPEEMEYL